MDREQQYQIMKEELFKRKELFYVENPELKKWVDTKKLLLKCLRVFLVLHQIIFLVVMFQMQDMTGWQKEVFKVLFWWFLVGVLMRPEGNWKRGLIFYIWAGVNILAWMPQLLEFQDVLAEVLYWFSNMPLAGILFIMEFLMLFLFLVLGIYLTAFKKNREMSEAVEEGIKEITMAVNALINEELLDETGEENGKIH